MSDKITVAFAGPADVTLDACKGLLNDYLGFGEDDAEGFPEPSLREIELIFPITDNLSAGMENVLLWSEYVDLPFTAVVDKAETLERDDQIVQAAEIVKATNVNAKIVEMLAKAEGESLLVLLWGEGDEGGDENTEMLMDLADTEGIHVVDLTAGMDDMVFTEEAPEVVPEPEPIVTKPRGSRRAKPVDSVAGPVDEEPKPRRGRARKAEEPLVQDEVPLTDETPAEPVKPARKSRKKAEPEAEPEVTDETTTEEDVIVSNGVIAARPPVFESMDLIKGTLSAVWLYLQSETENDALLMLDETVEESPLAVAVREALEALEGVATLSAEAHLGEPKRGRGRPRREPSDDDTTAYLQDEDGILRTAGRGRPRRGETRVELTAAEFDAKVKAGLFEDEG